MEKMSRRNEPVLHEELTNRENEILMLISEGKSNQEIADELFITLKTVKTHVSNILAKLEVEDRTQAAIYEKITIIFLGFFTIMMLAFVFVKALLY